MKYENLMTIDELRDYLPDHPSKATIYMWASRKKIPYKKLGKLFFDKDQIDKWNEDGRPVSE